MTLKVIDISPSSMSSIFIFSVMGVPDTNSPKKIDLINSRYRHRKLGEEILISLGNNLKSLWFIAYFILGSKVFNFVKSFKFRKSFQFEAFVYLQFIILDSNRTEKSEKKKKKNLCISHLDLFINKFYNHLVERGW